MGKNRLKTIKKKASRVFLLVALIWMMRDLKRKKIRETPGVISDGHPILSANKKIGRLWAGHLLVIVHGHVSQSFEFDFCLSE